MDIGVGRLKPEGWSRRGIHPIDATTVPHHNHSIAGSVAALLEPAYHAERRAHARDGLFTCARKAE
jgi:hypothetical protein